MYYENELYHHGVKGQKWGVRRFQPYSLIPRKSGKKGKEISVAAKKTFKKTINAAKRKAVAVKKAMDAKSKAAAQKAAERAKKKEEYKKDDLINHAPADVVYKNRHLLTGQELGYANTRLENEKKLKRITEEEKKSGWDTLATITSRARTVHDAAKAGIDIYNDFAKIANAKEIDKNGDKAKIRAIIGDKPKKKDKNSDNKSMEKTMKEGFDAFADAIREGNKQDNSSENNNSKKDKKDNSGKAAWDATMEVLKTGGSGLNKIFEAGSKIIENAQNQKIAYKSLEEESKNYLDEGHGAGDSYDEDEFRRKFGG